jgi:hypothetical protein
VAPRPAVALVLALAIGCGPDADAAPGPSVEPTVPPAAATSSPPSVLDQITAAYRRSWAVYAAAVRHLEVDRLPRAFAGSALLLKRREVASLRAAGEAIRVRVEHHVEVALIDDRTAVVTDVLANHMVRVDPTSGRPLEPDPDDELVRAYTLRREGGTWKVTEAVSLA